MARTTGALKVRDGGLHVVLRAAWRYVLSEVAPVLTTMGANAVSDRLAVPGVIVMSPELDEPLANAGGARFCTE